MLSRSLKRALLDSRWPLPPTFLLPWSAGLTTVSHNSDPNAGPPPLAMPERSGKQTKLGQRTPMNENDLARSTQQVESLEPLPSPTSPISSAVTPLEMSPSLRDLLPVLKAQSSHYITVHIHGKPYLLTQGDTVRLPFFMHGVQPGDVLRLNRAINIGSRDYTLKAAAAAPKFQNPTRSSANVLSPMTSVAAGHIQMTSQPSPESDLAPLAKTAQHAPHFIPHIEKGKHGYLDERLFVCRAVVMGVDSEPMRLKEKTKRRQRKVKTVRSKHRFTVLRVKELRIKSVAELVGGDEV